MAQRFPARCGCAGWESAARAHRTPASGGYVVGWHDGGMAQRMITTLIDDLDGVELARGSGETVRFGLDGRDYEIDLSDHNAAELREVLAPYVGAGRRNVALRSRRGRR